jgi:enoyl-CoA hydratase/carnithine racemase
VLAGDVRVAMSDATFAENGVSLGLFGAPGRTARLPELVGVGVAQDGLLSGRVVETAEALRMGLVSRVVEGPRDLARETAAHDPDATRTIAELVRDRSPLDVAEEQEAKALAVLVGAADLANRNR